MSNLSEFISRVSLAITGNTSGTLQTVGNGTFVLAGGPNVTLSQDGRTVTVSANPGGGAGGVAVSAGTSSQSTGTVVFSDSNGLTFGLSDGTLTGSYTVPVVPPETPFAVSAGTQSVSTGTLVFSNSNGISFGMSGSSRITASYTVPTVPAQISVGDSNVGNTLGNTGVVTGRLVLAGGNNVTLSGSTNAGSMTITVSAANQTVQTQNLHNVTLSGNTAGVLADISSGTMTLAGGANITLSQNGNAVTISGPNPVGGAFSAGVSTGGNTSGDTGVTGTRLVLAATNNITLSQGTDANGATVTVSGPTNGGITLAGNSTSAGAGFILISSGTMTLAGGNNMTLSQDGNAVTISGPNTAAETPFAVSAGTQSVSTGTLVFSDSNNVTFGMSGSSRITASASFPAETPFAVSAGTQSVSTGTLVFSNSNNVTFGMSGSSRVTASASFPAETPFGVSAGTQSVSTGTLVFSNSNNIAFGMSGSSRVTVSAALSMFAVSNTTQSSSGSANISALSFAGAGVASVGVTGGSVVVSVPAGGGAFSAGVSTGGNTVGVTGVTGTRLVLVADRGITLSQTTDVNGATITIRGPYTSTNDYGFQNFQPHSMANISNLTALSRRVIFAAFENNHVMDLDGVIINLSRSTTGSNLFTVEAGIYSFTQGSFNADTTWSCSYSNTNTALVSGLRQLYIQNSVLSAYSVSAPGRYYLGLWFDPGATASMNYSIMGAATNNSPLGFINTGANSADTATANLDDNLRYANFFVAANTSTGIPSSFFITDLDQWNSYVPFYFQVL